MSDEIYLNTGTTIQQPYQAQGPANAQQPVIAQQVRNYTANARQPNTYSTRTPFTYRNPSSAREPSIGNERNPFTYARQGRSPFTYNLRTPNTYARQGRSPFTYSHRQPITYERQGQTPIIYQHRQPSTYRNPVNQQEPNIRNKQSPFTYGHPAAGQSPFTYQYRSPFTYQRTGRSPFTYQATGTTPVIYSYQQPYPYIANGQQPTIKNAQQPYPFTSVQSSSTPTLAQGRQPYIYAAWSYVTTPWSGTAYVVESINNGTDDSVNCYMTCKYNGNNIEVYLEGANDDTTQINGTSVTRDVYHLVGTLVDAGTGYKCRYVRSNYRNITQADSNAGPAVVPIATSINCPNTTSTTGGTAISTSQNFNRVRFAVGALVSDETGSASAEVDVTMHFDKTGATSYQYAVTMYGELEIQNEWDDGEDGV